MYITDMTSSRPAKLWQAPNSSRQVGPDYWGSIKTIDILDLWQHVPISLI